MQIKRFEASNMKEALGMVKEQFGPEAVILSARSIKKDKGIYRFLARPGVEVTAAIDNDYGALEKHTSTDDKSLHIHDMRPDLELKGPESGGDKANISKGIFNRFQRELKVLRNRRETGTPERIVQSQGNARLMAIRKKILSHGVKEDTVNALLKSMEDNSASFSIINGNRGSRLVQALKEVGLQVGPIEKRGKRRKVVTLMGTPGVGKTTTAAKIAAFHLFEMGEKVAMISLDDNRIGAVEQLKTYAKIMGIPIEFASNRKGLKRSIKGLIGNDLILIDTPGITQKNTYEIKELKGLLERTVPFESHLLLSATFKDEDLKDIVESFSLIPIDRIIFTKIDGSATLGSVLNEAVRTKIPISYLTNGQQIPEDIEPASLEKIADLLLGERGWKESNYDTLSEEPLGGYKYAVGSPVFTEHYRYNGRSDVLHYPGCKC